MNIKFKILSVLTLVAAVFVLSACGGSTTGSKDPQSLLNIYSPLTVKPTTSTDYLIQIDPVAQPEMPVGFPQQAVRYYAVYTFSKDSETKVIVSPILNTNVPTMQGYSLTSTAYFRISPVEARSVVSPSAFKANADKAIYILCRSTPNCQ